MQEMEEENINMTDKNREKGKRRESRGIKQVGVGVLANQPNNTTQLPKQKSLGVPC